VQYFYLSLYSSTRLKKIIEPVSNEQEASIAMPEMRYLEK